MFIGWVENSKLMIVTGFIPFEKNIIQGPGSAWTAAALSRTHYNDRGRRAASESCVHDASGNRDEREDI
jgi:hypothetical protein